MSIIQNLLSQPISSFCFFTHFSFSSTMASSAVPQTSYSLLLPSRINHSPKEQKLTKRLVSRIERGNARYVRLGVFASQKRERPPPGVDTRIHWDNEEEGWVGGSSSTTSSEDPQEQQKNLLGETFADLLNDSSDSHYQFLGVSVEADLEEIKGAYRRLSKEYHPDTTSLPLKAASDKFLKLREVYDVLSDDEKRKFYDWTLAQEAASRQAEKMRMKLEDPSEKEVESWESVPDMVDRLGGRNLELSDQAMSALTIDIFIVLFAICCIVYVIFFKEPYY